MVCSSGPPGVISDMSPPCLSPPVLPPISSHPIALQNRSAGAVQIKAIGWYHPPWWCHYRCTRQHTVGAPGRGALEAAAGPPPPHRRTADRRGDGPWTEEGHGRRVNGMVVPAHRRAPPAPPPSRHARGHRGPAGGGRRAPGRNRDRVPIAHRRPSALAAAVTANQIIACAPPFVRAGVAAAAGPPPTGWCGGGGGPAASLAPGGYPRLLYR
jgi:hypothetical protein